MELHELLYVCQLLYEEKTSLMVTLRAPKHLTCKHAGKVYSLIIPLFLQSLFLIPFPVLTLIPLKGVLHFKWAFVPLPTGPSLSNNQKAHPPTASHQRKQSTRVKAESSPKQYLTQTPTVPTATTPTPHQPLTLKIRPPPGLIPHSPSPKAGTPTPPKSSRKKKADRDKATPTAATSSKGGDLSVKAKKAKRELSSSSTLAEQEISQFQFQSPSPSVPVVTQTTTPPPQQQQQRMLKIKLKLGKSVSRAG